VAVFCELGLHFLVHTVGQGGHKVKLALAAVGVALGGGGTQRPRIVPEGAVRFQRDGVVRVDGAAAAAGAGGVAALHRKAVLAAPDNGIVIVSAAGQTHKIVDRHGS